MNSLAADDWYNVAVDILKAFTMHFGICPSSSPPQLLKSVVKAFARLPYENITKIVKLAEYGSPEKSRRYPVEVIRDHIRWGSGGTCFSLTSALMSLVRSLGWKAEYVLADRRYGQDTHCALLLWIDGKLHLLDPGFLIVNPIPVSGGVQEIDTGFNRLVLAPEDSRNRLSLSTIENGSKGYRLTYKTSPVDEREFLKAWDTSFGWDMMQYPLLTRIAATGRVYLRGTKLRISTADSVEKKEIPSDDLISKIAAEFHIHPAVVARAISVLEDGG